MPLLYRTTTPAGPTVYRSPTLEAAGIPHAFSTRRGGLSTGPFDSLNLAMISSLKSAHSDDPRNLSANLARLILAVQGSPRRIAAARQVHGSDLCFVADPGARPEADALATDDPAHMVMVRIADCVPVLLADRTGRCVAAVHAGWRGMVAGIIPSTLNAMCQRWNVEPQAMIAAVGPAISAAHFEVGEEVAAAFEQASLADALVRQPGDKPHVDLPAAARQQLLAAGLEPSTIDHTDRCTFRDIEEFFSHRRDQGRTGRQVAIIGPASR